MKILFATDGSPCSLHAIREGIRLLPLRQARVHVLGVTEAIIPMMAYEGAGGAMPLVLDREFVATKKDLTSALDILSKAGVTATPVECDGIPADEILATARELAVDLIVMGSHGGNALERFILGSVSDRVLHNHDGAVLIVRPTKEA